MTFRAFLAFAAHSPFTNPIELPLRTMFNSVQSRNIDLGYIFMPAIGIWWERS